MEVKIQVNLLHYSTLFMARLVGEIVHGDGRGKALGFPTLNVEGDFSDLQQGVYAVWVYLSGKKWKGAMNYGAQPSFSSQRVRLEIAVLDFSGDVYGQMVEFEPVQKIRATQRFESPQDLRVQIQKDIEQIRKILTE